MLVALLGCSDDQPSVPESRAEPAIGAIAPKSTPQDETVVPALRWADVRQPVTSPAAVGVDVSLQATREVLEAVVLEHARDPGNPWAVSHAILALGPDITLVNGRDAVDWLFLSYAELSPVGSQPGIRYPAKRGSIRIEPHTDLILKALTEAGLRPERRVEVAGAERTLGDLYRHSLSRTWVDGAVVSAGSWNDMPWTLQALASWAPEDLRWTSAGIEMSMDGLTSAVVDRLASETAFMHRAMAAGTTFEKKGQGIFGYTCGGAHLLQGAAHAVGRGFGADEHRAHIEAEVDVLYWRFAIELGIVDQALQQHPDYALILLEQRLKFVGHFLESAHKLAALGFYDPTSEQQALLSTARAELVKTVGVLKSMGVFDRLTDLRATNEQMYLDFVGDSAHALRGIDLSTGIGVVH